MHLLTGKPSKTRIAQCGQVWKPSNSSALASSQREELLLVVLSQDCPRPSQVLVDICFRRPAGMDGECNALDGIAWPLSG